VTPGADAGGEGGGWDAARRVVAGPAGAGAVRRAGFGFVSLGAVTVTSGSVSDIWPQAGPGEVSPPSNGNAPKATAPKSRRFQTRSRDELRLITPHAPNITPQNFPTGILSYCPPTVSGSFGKADENIWQCVPWDTPDHAVMSTCQKETVVQSQK
jgi:hypothetical protein